MAKFVFRLQNVLNIKANLESQARSNFAMAQARLNEEEAILEGMFQTKKALEDHYRELAEGTLNVKELLEARRAIDFQKELIAEQIQNLQRAEKNLEIARARLNEAMKERKTYEKLRERAFEEFLAEMNEEEKKEIDELVSYRFNENSAG